MALYADKSLKNALNCINNQILCYLTACEAEQHHLNAAEEAITKYIIPRVEELLTDDNINGGEHSMSRKWHQGQMGLFYNNNAYLVNYQFAKGVLCDAYRKAGILPAEGARNVGYEGERLLSMVDDICVSAPSLSRFAEKYHRELPLVCRDRLMNGLGLSLQRVAEHGFPRSELVDMTVYQSGVSLWITADKKIMDNTMFVFISHNRQALDFGSPKLENGVLYAGGAVQRYDIIYEFKLPQPEVSKDIMSLSVKIDLVYDILENKSRLVNDISVDFTTEESAKICSVMKRLFFPHEYYMRKNGNAVTVGEEFTDNYYIAYGTPEQKKAVSDKWEAVDSGYRRIMELSRQNKKS